MQRVTEQDYIFGESMDAMFYTVFIRKAMTPNKLTPAYQMGIIDASGKILREPQNKEERRAFTFIDRLAIYMKRYMQGRIRVLYSEYIRKRRDPHFIKAMAKALGFRYGRYFNIKNVKTNIGPQLSSGE